MTDSALDRFRSSMEIGYEEWHDGVGYDLDALTEMSPDERLQVEQLLAPRAGSDWRDVEALAALATPRADAALLTAFGSAGAAIRVAILRDAPHLFDDIRRAAELVRLVDECDLGDGMTQVLLLVEEVHPPEVEAALLRGTLDLDREVPIHYAAMLLFLAGLAAEPFDWEVREFVLGFTTRDPDERAGVHAALCERLRGRFAWLTA